MPKALPIQVAFNGGEMSPYIAGRPDVAKYGVGCETMQGFIPLTEGPAITRPGTPFVAEVKSSTQRTWLMRFEFSATDSYMLEFGDLYVRFYFARAQVVVSGVAAYSGATAYVPGDKALQGGVNYHCTAATTGNAPPNAAYWYAMPGSVYEIPSPYSSADLTNSEGAFALRFAQTGDVIRIVGGGKPMQLLSRLAATRWTLAPAVLKPPPFAEQNITATTLVASGSTGTVTVTASADVFTAARVGQYLMLREADVRDVKRWEVNKAVSISDRRRASGNNYVALTAGTTGAVQPIHTSGAEYDGDPGVQWSYEDSGAGWLKITGYTDAQHVTGDVVSSLPFGATTGTPTTRWAFEAWNATDGYPTSITFFRERLTLARGATIWFSVAGGFDDFSTEIDGLIVSDAGFERTLASDRANDIRWLSPGVVLLVGTVGDEWAVTESTTSDPFGPENCKTLRQSAYGSNTVGPQRVGNETLFVQRAGAKVRAMASQFEDAGFSSPNVGAFARTITRTGIVDMAFQQEPWSVVWMVRGDGLMIGLTLDREQEVVAWHRHPFEGGAVECVECTPSPNGTQDDLWVIVRYTVEGVTRRYIAYMADPDDETTDQREWIYSDMLLTYRGAAATTISGLDVHEGKTVWVLADGGRHPDRVVVGGQIELQDPASVVHVGLPSPAVLVTTNMEVGSPGGTSQGKTKRTTLATVRLYRSLGGKAGPSEARVSEMQYRAPSVPMGIAPPPYTGDVDVEWDDDYSKQLRVAVIKDRPMPMTLVSVMPQADVQAGR